MHRPRIAVPRLNAALETARRTKVIQDIGYIAYEIDLYKQMYGVLPLDLPDKRLDPWGNPYQYLNFSTVKGKGQMRKNKFLVPINTDYDLYSMGPDGKSVAPLTAKASRDDIIRANDGQFFGPASEY
ncbi:MAG: prepilin-type cleavage/methylation domain-containing protein [Planctomycetota bacterium]